MTGALLDGGRPVFVAAPDRIGAGPWARWLATAVVADEGSARAERGRTLARTGHVHNVAVTVGEITARVIGSGDSEYEVALRSEPLPPRIWTAVAAAAEGKALLEGASGRTQSVHLEHLMAVEWGQPLVPRPHALGRSCTCPDAGRGEVCKHVAALAYVVADAIDRDPSLLLRWRGWMPAATAPAPGSSPVARDPWAAGALPPARPARSLPPGAVLKRLGPSGARSGGKDLVDLLAPAYEVFAQPRR